jgi:hypothetical protein
MNYHLHVVIKQLMSSGTPIPIAPKVSWLLLERIGLAEWLPIHVLRADQHDCFRRLEKQKGLPICDLITRFVCAKQLCTLFTQQLSGPDKTVQHPNDLCCEAFSNVIAERSAGRHQLRLVQRRDKCYDAHWAIQQGQG